MNLFMQRQEFHLFYGGIQVIYPFLEKINIIPSNYNDTRCSTDLSALCALENVSVRHECPLHCFLIMYIHVSQSFPGHCLIDSLEMLSVLYYLYFGYLMSVVQCKFQIQA